MVNRPKVVVVNGDVTMDWNIARLRTSRGGSRAWNTDDRTRACLQPGGAVLLADLLEHVAEELRQSRQADIVVRAMAAPPGPIHPGDERFHHSYAMWSLFKYSEKGASSHENQPWRIDEFLGLDRSAAAGASEMDNWNNVVDDVPEADLVVLDDADLGFRDRPDLWPKAVKDTQHPAWIVLKMARPVAQGPLWEHLHQHFADHLVVVMTVNDLRLTEVQISRELSWESSAQDLFWELTRNPRVNSLASCAHVVISFGPGGAALFSRQPSSTGAATAPIGPTGYLFFDREAIEGSWERDYPGKMTGYTTCLTAGIARELMRSPDRPDIHQALQSGLNAMRRLHLEGYGQPGAAGARVSLAFPTARVVAALSGEAAPFAVAEIQDPVRTNDEATAKAKMAPATGNWTILQDRYPDSLKRVANQILVEGVESALRDVPVARFGDLVTADRKEIEALRSIRSLIAEYCRQPQKRPLSIGVFGPPGSGKSFAVEQVANAARPGEITTLGFNLSQFGEPKELLGALHQVRDVGLSGRIPLVFWDEFDTALEGQPLGWLRYFLAFMQDGAFLEGQITHPIGRCIFVFAGGTSSSVEGFDQKPDPDTFRAAKGPDFVSRLKGFVNILGPDPQPGTIAGRPVSDPGYIIRRAILVRSLIKRGAPQLFEKDGDKEILNIDPGVRRAFLETVEYKHGVRSIESLIAMSLLAGKSRFERSSLPAVAQLDLHVNGLEFLSLVRQLELGGELLESLAEAVHLASCERLRAKGYHWGPQTNDRRKTHSSLKPYGELPEDQKQQNRGDAQDIRHKLARAGYVMIPARSNEAPFDFPDSDLELLAEMEHERWMTAKIEAGWRWAPTTNTQKRLNKSMLPWRRLSGEERARLYSAQEREAIGTTQLPKGEKEKDRDRVRRIPQILARAGYTIVKIKPAAKD